MTDIPLEPSIATSQMEDRSIEQRRAGGTRAIVANVGVPLLAGVLVFVLLFPVAGIDPIPPQCFSAFSYNVPCIDGLAVVAGIGTAVVVFLLRRWKARPS